jgi:hypothetical protein
MYTICICEAPAREEADGRMVMNEAASAERASGFGDECCVFS